LSKYKYAHSQVINYNYVKFHQYLIWLRGVALTRNMDRGTEGLTG